MTRSEKIALLTGTTDGMGRLFAPMIAKAGYHVVVQGRNALRGQEVVDQILAEGGSAEFMACNLSSVADIRRFAETFKAKFTRLDVLVNNAGIGTGPDDAPRLVSDDGHEFRFAVNYLAGYLLNHLLQDLVVAAAPARIVNVASEGQEPLDFDNIMHTHDYSGYWAYCRSKVAVIMMTIDMAEALKSKGVTVNAMHPGAYMNTTMVREMNHPVEDSVEDGARFVYELAVDPKFNDVSGRYICMGEDKIAQAQCYDAAARQRLHDLTVEILGL